MTNWELVREEIREEYNKIATHPDNTRCERDNMVRAIKTVVQRYTNDRDRNLFENIDWLTRKSENKEPSRGKLKHPIITCKDYFEYMEWLKVHEQKSQQRARFIKTNHPQSSEANRYYRYINVSSVMPNIKYIDDGYLGAEIVTSVGTGFTHKPTDEVIQQLGIEVV